MCIRDSSRGWRIILAAVLMGAVLWITAQILNPMFGGSWRGLALALLVGTGMLSYFGFAQMLGAVKMSELRGALRRQR